MIRRHPALLAALVLCALPERTPTPEEERERVLKKLRTDLAREGESPEEVARISAALDLEAVEIADGSIRDWGWAFEQARRHWRARRSAERLTLIEQAIGRTMAEVNRERRARGELGTKRQRKARRG